MTKSGKPLRYISAQWISTGTERKVSYESFRRKGHEGRFFSLRPVHRFLQYFYLCVPFANGLPAMGKIGPLKFLFGTEWRPTNDKFGIPANDRGKYLCNCRSNPYRSSDRTFTSVFMARYCPKKIYKPLKSGIELYGRRSIHRIWLFWSGSPGAADPPAVRRNRKQYAGGMYPLWES